ncbi:MAG: SusD/RagB family nutrient-binding outer membrane lipoprotein [Muribaculaceae bacterium]|nr:SusD/RagB family nutrient-binding outer membrane lipoprotein [Muribaculaceae bacterium]
MKKSIISALVLSAAVGFTSCDDYLDVNTNVDAPDNVEGYLYLAGITESYFGVYWDGRAAAPLTQMLGTTGYTSFANHSYSAGSDAGGEIWRMVYWLHGMNLENLINQSIEAENWTLAGMGLAMKAFDWDALTKYHGECPLHDAYVPGLLSHSYDSQEEIMAQARAWAYQAIEYLEKEDNTEYGKKLSDNDYIYKGDPEKWKKFAYSVIVRDLAALSNKKDFSEKYAQELISCAAKAFSSADDDAVVSVSGQGASDPFTAYNNFWGPYRGNLSRSYFQHDYAVQVMTGAVRKYNEETGDLIPVENNKYFPYELMDKQIICDTLYNEAGHYDPRMVVKLGTVDDPMYNNTNNADSIKAHRYFGGTFTGYTGPIGAAPSLYGRNATSSITLDGSGRWLYADGAPYVLMTAAEINFCLAEAYWKLGRKADAFEAFKNGVKEDLAFTAKYIVTGTAGKQAGGDKISKSLFNTLAAEYAAGPFVEGLSLDEFSLSHIMMQKFVALFPWGSLEEWVDQRKYHYDIAYTGDYPSEGNGWSTTVLDQKWDTDPTKVYKGFYLLPANVQLRKGSYGSTTNAGSPCYRVRPRYNSEYMWNIPSLEKIKPISGMSNFYHTSIPWFAYPGDMPQ